MKTSIHSEINRIAYKMLGYGNNISHKDFIELKETLAKLQEQIVITIDQQEREYQTNTNYNQNSYKHTNNHREESPLNNVRYSNSNDLFQPKQENYQNINLNYSTGMIENNRYSSTKEQNNINAHNRNHHPRSLNNKLKSSVNNIGLNDKILLTNKLFKGDIDIYHQAINRLQSIENTQDRMNYLERNIKSQNAMAWERNKKEAHRFVDLFVA